MPLVWGLALRKIKKKKILFALSTPRWLIQDMVGISQNFFVFQLCYLNRLEQEKC
jgi:hypothetical protein